MNLVTQLNSISKDRLLDQFNTIEKTSNGILMSSMEETSWPLPKMTFVSLLQTQDYLEVTQSFTEILPKFIGSLKTPISSLLECMLIPLTFGKFSTEKSSNLRWLMERLCNPSPLLVSYQDFFIQRDNSHSIPLIF